MKKSLLSTLCVLLPLTATNAADVFTLTTNENILYESGKVLNEYLIYTADKQCFLHYLSPVAPSQNQTIQITKQSDLKEVQCLEKGFASVDIKDEKNNSLQTLNGYFLNGFFIGATPLNSYAIKRSANADGTQHLYYFIDKDDELDIEYIGKMNAHLINGVYTSFESCSPFEVTLKTQNKDLFKENDTIQNLFTVAKSYALTLCPQVQQITFSATESPSLADDGIFFKEVLYKDALSGLWIQDMKQSFNYVMNPAPKKVKEKVTQEKQSSLQTTVAQTQTQHIVHISDKSNGKILFIDKPYLMKARRNKQTAHLKSGWYKVDAIITPMSDFEKKRSGISLNEKAAEIKIQAAEKCENAACN